MRKNIHLNVLEQHDICFNDQSKREGEPFEFISLAPRDSLSRSINHFACYTNLHGSRISYQRGKQCISVSRPVVDKGLVEFFPREDRLSHTIGITDRARSHHDAIKAARVRLRSIKRKEVAG